MKIRFIHKLRITIYIHRFSNSSPNGSQIAFHQTTYTRSNHEIIVMKENNLQVSHVLSGHLSLIYDIDWLNERILISVASDRTAIVWFLSDGDFKIKVLLLSSDTFIIFECLSLRSGLTAPVICLCIQVAKQIRCRLCVCHNRWSRLYFTCMENQYEH